MKIHIDLEVKETEALKKSVAQDLKKEAKSIGLLLDEEKDSGDDKEVSENLSS